MAMIGIHVAMPCFGRAEKTELALERFFEVTDPAHVSITCVDDGSTDHTVDVLNKYADRIGIIRNGRNLGVAKSVADAWLGVDAAVYMKLDNDTLLNRPEWWKAILSAASGLENLGVIGFPVAPVWEKTPKRVIPRTDWQWRRVNRACVNGAAMAIPRAAFERMGYPFIFPHPYSGFDGEYSARARACGFKTGYILGNWAEQISPAKSERGYERWKKRSHKFNFRAIVQRTRGVTAGNAYVAHWRTSVENPNRPKSSE